MRRAALGVDGANAAPPLLRALGVGLLPAGVDRDKLLGQLGVRDGAGSAPAFGRLADFKFDEGTEPSPEAADWLRQRCSGGGAGSVSLARTAAWLAKADAPLAEVVTASRAASLYVPVPRDEGAALEGFARINPIRLAVAMEALRCRAALRLLRGDGAGSWADVEAMWKLGLLAGRSATLGEYALAGAFWRSAMSGTVDLGASPGTSAEMLSAMRKTLEVLPGFPPATETLMLQRLAVLNAFATPLVAKPGAGAQPGAVMAPAGTVAVLEGINQRYDALDGALQTADHGARLARIEQAEAQAVQAAEKEKSLGGRLASRLQREVPIEATAEFAGQLVALCRSMLGVEIKAVTSQRLARVALAIAKRAREKGVLPASLTEVGGEVPKDPANGGAFGYKPTGKQFVLYGVGADGRDDGADPARDEVALSQEPPRAPAP
jgi:hypothetical protein